MKALTREWLKAASDDLMTIEEIIDNTGLTHIVAFHAQQCVEKTFKSILEENQIEIPKIHKLNQLWGKLTPFGLEVDQTMLILLDQLYIDSRYPGDFGLLPNGKPTQEEARCFYEFAKEIHATVENLMENP